MCVFFVIKPGQWRSTIVHDYKGHFSQSHTPFLTPPIDGPGKNKWFHPLHPPWFLRSFSSASYDVCSDGDSSHSPGAGSRSTRGVQTRCPWSSDSPGLWLETWKKCGKIIWMCLKRADPQNHWFTMVQSNMLKFEWFGGIPDFRKPLYGDFQVQKKLTAWFSVPRRLGKGQSNGSSCEASRLHRLDVWEPTSGSAWWKVADFSAFNKYTWQILTAHSPILRLSKAWPSNPTTLRPERQAPIHTHGGEGTGEDTHARVPGQRLVLKAAPKTPEAESGSHLGIHQPKGQGLVTHNGLKHQIHGMKKWWKRKDWRLMMRGHTFCVPNQSPKKK